MDKKNWGLKILEKKYIDYAFHLLYVKACSEQAKEDDRIVSSKMYEIEKLKKWYEVNIQKEISP